MTDHGLENQYPLVTAQQILVWIVRFASKHAADLTLIALDTQSADPATQLKAHQAYQKKLQLLRGITTDHRLLTEHISGRETPASTNLIMAVSRAYFDPQIHPTDENGEPVMKAYDHYLMCADVRGDKEEAAPDNYDLMEMGNKTLDILLQSMDTRPSTLALLRGGENMPPIIAHPESGETIDTAPVVRRPLRHRHPGMKDFDRDDLKS